MLSSLRTLAQLPATAGVSAEDIQAFCADRNVSFYALGRPEDWNDESVFRVGTHTGPAMGVTVPYTAVLDWKQAMARMGERRTFNALYRHFRTGGVYEAIGTCMLEAEGAPAVLYKGADGVVWARATARFFEVVPSPQGGFEPRFAYLGPVQPEVQEPQKHWAADLPAGAVLGC